MSSITPVPRRFPRRGKTGEVIARDILRRIREEHLGPGAQLPTESQMIAEYGVGRGTLREALRMLEVPGLITIKPGPGGGPVVAGATSHDFGRMATLFFQAEGLTVGELVEARLILEPITGRLAAERQDPEGIERLRTFLEGDYPGEEPSYLRESYDFHQIVVSMSGNGIVSLFASALSEVFHDRVAGVVFPTKKRRKEVYDVHRAIAEAIIHKDPPLAERLMYEHMEQYVKYVKSRFSSLVDEVVDWR